MYYWGVLRCSLAMDCHCCSFPDINECETRLENICSGLCVDQEGTYSCDCPEGRTLASDQVNCGGKKIFPPSSSLPFLPPPPSLPPSPSLYIALTSSSFLPLSPHLPSLPPSIFPLPHSLPLLFTPVCPYNGMEYLLGDRVKIGCNWW